MAVRRLIGRVLLFITLLCLTLVAAEGALRLADYWPVLSNGWMLDSEHRTPDADVISIDRRYLDDATYTPYQVVAPTKLIVALGDSYTAGVPVGPTEAYPAALEQSLQRAGKDIKVMNAGLGDSGPDQQLAVLTKYVLPRVHPDVVVWQFYPNDSLDNAMKALHAVGPDGTLVPLDARDNWMYRRQTFYDSVPLPAAIKRGSYLFNLLLRRYERDRTVAVPEGSDPTSWGRQKIPLNIARMTALAKQHGFTLYLTLVAPQASYEPVESNTPAFEEWTEYPKLLELLQGQPNFIHVKFDEATVAARGGAKGIFSGAEADPNPFGMRHFNAAGYGLMAQAIAARLEGQPMPSLVMDAVSRVTFGQSAARKWMRSGWHLDEAAGVETYVWSEGDRSVLELPLATGQDLRMTFECQPLLYPGSPQQVVTVVLNGTEVQHVPLGPKGGQYSVVLPTSAMTQPLSTLEFRYAYAKRLVDVQPGAGDTRVLAVAWHSIDFAGIKQP